MRYIIFSGAGTIGALMLSLLGGWDHAISALIFLMAIDIILGLILAAIFKKNKRDEDSGVESRRCWKGVARKCVTLMFVGIGYRLDYVLGTDFIRTAVIIAFISNELVSIIENAGLMGVPMPPVLQKAIDVLNKKSEKQP